MKFTITSLILYDGEQVLKGYTINDDAIALAVAKGKWLVAKVSEDIMMDYMNGEIDLRAMFTTHQIELFSGEFEGNEGEVTSINPIIGQAPERWLPAVRYHC
jgi:hypothetical protein